MFLFRYVQAVDQRSSAFCPLEFKIARILRRSKLSGKTEFNHWQFNDLVRKYAFPLNIVDLSVYVAAKTMILTRFMTIIPFNTAILASGKCGRIRVLSYLNRLKSHKIYNDSRSIFVD